MHESNVKIPTTDVRVMDDGIGQDITLKSSCSGSHIIRDMSKETYVSSSSSSSSAPQAYYV